MWGHPTPRQRDFALRALPVFAVKLCAYTWVQYRVANLEQFANQVTETQKIINELVDIKN